jgi:hypothetical protein
MMKQFDHMIERKLNPRLKFLAGCGQFSDFSNSLPNFQNLINHACIFSYLAGSQKKISVSSVWSKLARFA